VATDETVLGVPSPDGGAARSPDELMVLNPTSSAMIAKIPWKPASAIPDDPEANEDLHPAWQGPRTGPGPTTQQPKV
jgi:hypothetical protein